MVSDKVSRKREQSLYVEVDEEGKVYPPEDIEEAMMYIDDMVEDGEISEYYMGMYDTLLYLLSTPLALFQTKTRQLMDEIITSYSLDESIDSEEDTQLLLPAPDKTETTTTKEKEKPMTKPSTELTIAEETELMDAKEIDEWYRKETKINVQGWYTRPLEQRKAIRNDFYAKKAVWKDELSDEETLKLLSA